MGYKILDIQLWDDLKKTVLNEKNCPKKDIPKRLRVVRPAVSELPYMLDLHGQTVQDAFDKTASFLAKHHRAGHREVLIVTGKGTMGQGLIKKEFDGWINNPKIKKYVRTTQWQNRGGAVKITLTKK